MKAPWTTFYIQNMHLVSIYRETIYRENIYWKTKIQT